MKNSSTFYKRFHWTLRALLYIFLTTISLTTCVFVIVHFSTKASNNRDWNDDQAILPYAEIHDNLVSIHNIRNFSYASTTSYTKNYYDKVFDLNKIKRAWYVVEPFSGIPGSAHTFLSFEFEGDNASGTLSDQELGQVHEQKNDPQNSQFVAISVEIRKENEESFHPVKGLFNKYELMYVIADEKDAIKLRTNYRKDLVYLYPAKTTKEKTKALFLDMIKRANELRDTPEFYNSITNTCTTNIVRHINTVTPNRLPSFSLDILLPANSDELAYKYGLIDTDLSFEDARKKYFINDKALQYADDPDFSVRVR